MKKNLFLMLGLGALLLTSCDQDITNEIYLPGGGGSVVVTDSTSTKQLQVFTNLEMLQPAYNTRAVDGQWETNDSIGISSTGLIENLKYVRVGTTNRFETATSWWFKDTGTHTFNAYYPYNGKPTSDLISFTVPNTATQAAQKKNDFLFATGTASGSSDEVYLNFRHKMAKVTLKMYTATEYGFSTSDFSNTTLSFIDFDEKGTFNIKTGEVKTTGSTYKEMVFTGAAKTNYMEFILYVPAQAAPDMLVRVNTTGESFIFIPMEQTKWESGRSYTYNMKPLRNTLEITGSSITNWDIADSETMVGYE